MGTTHHATDDATTTETQTTDAAGESTQQQQQAEERHVPLSVVTALREELQTLKAERDAAELAKLAEAGEWKTVAETREAELADVRTQLDTLSARETARLERVGVTNSKRLKALPANLRALVPDGLDADGIAEQLGRIEGIAGAGKISGTRATAAAAADVPAEARADALKHYSNEKRARYTEAEWVQFWFDRVWNTPKAKAARARNTQQ